MNKQNKVFFTVVIPFYNVEKYLDEAILSVIHQTFQNWELLLIDDGGSDNSIKIARKYVDIDSRISLYSHNDNKNKGVSSSRNLGIKHAKGSWIAFLDADDYWSLKKLEIEEFNLTKEKHSNIVFLYSKTQKVNQKKEKLALFGFGNPGLTVNAFEKTINGIFCHTSNFVVNTKIIKENNLLFNEGMIYSEDTLFFHECLLYGNLYFIDQDLSFFRINDSSTTNFINNSEKNSGRMRVYLELLAKIDSKYQDLVSEALVKVGFSKVFKLFIFKPIGNSNLFIKSFFKVLFHPKVRFKYKLKLFSVPYF